MLILSARAAVSSGANLPVLMRALAVAFFVLVCAVPALGATPAMSGLYHVGELGFLDFQVQEGRVVGKYKGGGACEFANDVNVVSGWFEGSVFVGTVLICQTGPGCEPKRSLPLLAVWKDDALAGQLKLDAGCTTAAFDTKTIVFTPATLEEKQKLLGDSNNPATAIATKNPKKDPAVAIKEGIAEGAKRLDAGDYRGASQAFRVVLSYDENNWIARLGVGSAQVKLKDPSGALEHLQVALEVAQKEKVRNDVLAQVHFNIACAQSQLGKKKDAINAIRTAVKLGTPGQFIDDLDTDPDLTPVRQEQEFRQIAAAARVAAAKAKKPK